MIKPSDFRPLVAVLIAVLLTSCAAYEAPQETELLCVAESSDWKATGRHEDVQAFLDQLAVNTDVVRLSNMGHSAEGRTMPLLILSDPPVETPEEARATGKLVVYAQGGIHSGECCGKESLQMLAREIVYGPNRHLLENLVILFVPNYNPDGNEQMDPHNRPGQEGPEHGMGIRATAEGYDLNRDNTKLDSPEAQSLSRLMTEWDPYLVIDTHTTNGSFHQNTLTFDGPVNPAGDQAIVDFVRNTYLPSVSQSLRDETGYKTTFYGNYNRDKTRWSTYDGRPRFGTRARGIRGIVSILTEAYKYASYKDRVLCTKFFCEHLLAYANENPEVFRNLVDKTRERTIHLGETVDPKDTVSIRTKIARLPKDLVLEGWVEKVPEGKDPRRTRALPTNVKKNYTMEHWGGYESTLDVVRPHGYAYPAHMKFLTEKLGQHGIQVDTLPRGTALKAEAYKIEDLKRASRKYQGHYGVTVQTSTHQKWLRTENDMCYVKTAHGLGNLIVYLLEPRADDGLTAWGLFDGVIKAGEEFPVLRLMDKPR